MSAPKRRLMKWPWVKGGDDRSYAVYDANEFHTADMHVVLGEVAQHSGVRKDPDKCSAANCLRHELGAQAAIIGLEHAYVLQRSPHSQEYVWVRWRNGSRKAIEAFDNGGPPPTEIHLKLMKPSETLVGKRKKNERRKTWPSEQPEAIKERKERRKTRTMTPFQMGRSLSHRVYLTPEKGDDDAVHTA